MADTAITLDFPQSITVAELQGYQHPEYNADKISRYDAFYYGGDEFRERIDDFLVKRRIESAPTAIASKIYGERKQRGWFIPLGSGIIDLIVGSEYKTPIKLTAQGDIVGTDDASTEPAPTNTGVQGPQMPTPLPTAVVQPVDPEIKSFWDELSIDCDGEHTDLQTLFKRVSYSLKLHGRAYFGVTYQKPQGEDERPYIFALGAEMVDDWTENYIRTKKCKKFASKGWGAPDRELYTWVYYTADKIFTYEWVKKLDAKVQPKNPKAELVSDIEHDFGRIPIFPIERDYNAWIMDRIFDLLIALYNRQVSLTYCIDALTYAIMQINLLPVNSTQLGSVGTTEQGGITLKVGEDISFKNPDPNIPLNAFKDEARLKQELFECLNAVATQAATQQGQNARQGPTAKGMDNEPWHVLLSTYVQPPEDAFEQVIEAIKDYKGETTTVKIEGLYNFGGSLDDVREMVMGTPQDFTDLQSQANNASVVAAIRGYTNIVGDLVRKQADPVNAEGSRIATAT